MALASMPGLDLAQWWRVFAGAMGLMVNMPMSPVSVVVLSMLSRGPGDGNKLLAFSLTLFRARRDGVRPGRDCDL